MIGEEQFTAKVLSMRDMLYRLSVSYLHSDADAQDAVQQAAENAWRHRDRVDEASFRPWFTRIVINECKSLLRRRRRVIPTDEPARWAGQTPPPDLSLADAIARLPDKTRTPLLLYYMDGFTTREIAKTLCLTETAVRSRMFRARNDLRRALEREDET